MGPARTTSTNRQILILASRHIAMENIAKILNVPLPAVRLIINSPLGRAEVQVLRNGN